MDRASDPFMALADIQADDPSAHRNLSPASASLQAGLLPKSPVMGTLHGFDLLEQPLVSGIQHLPGQLLTASSVVPLRREMIGQSVVIWFVAENTPAPVIMGVLQTRPLHEGSPRQPPLGHVVQIDDERHVIQAEREIVLRCGDASLTLTRAGKVIIKGNYILSRSTGYNKIKGAAIDIN